MEMDSRTYLQLIHTLGSIERTLRESLITEDQFFEIRNLLKICDSNLYYAKEKWKETQNVTDS